MMKISFSVFAIIFFLTIHSSAQIVQQTSSMPSRPRVVTTSTPIPSPTATPSRVVTVTNNLPSPTPTPIIKPTATPITNPIPVDRPMTMPTPTATPAPTTLPPSFKFMNFGQIKSRIAEAKRVMQTRLQPTALIDGSIATDTVRVAFYDTRAQQLDYATVSKTVFLDKFGDAPLITSNGKTIRIRIIRANGVNTPVTIFDQQTGEAYTPLVVQYPVERGGRYMETAYYTSTHPGIVTPEVVNAGKLYVRTTIDVAREKLREKGIVVTPQVADIAERLSTVEHVDHARFRNEYHPNIYNDIFTLYALNEGQTYRYSVSSAGAGGMVQMIPSTYAMVRNRYYSVGLMPDFVEGMRNHGNAAQAMLLYMKMTWEDLVANQTVAGALADGTATPAELMAAGYNSNPAKLAGYIRRGGNGWRNLIPRETKIYLQIYSSLESFVPMTPRTK